MGTYPRKLNCQGVEIKWSQSITKCLGRNEIDGGLVPPPLPQEWCSLAAGVLTIPKFPFPFVHLSPCTDCSRSPGCSLSLPSLGTHPPRPGSERPPGRGSTPHSCGSPHTVTSDNSVPVSFLPSSQVLSECACLPLTLLSITSPLPGAMGRKFVK